MLMAFVPIHVTYRAARWESDSVYSLDFIAQWYETATVAIELLRRTRVLQT